MRYKTDIESYIKNIEYYAEQIKSSVDKQFDEDFKSKEVNIDESEKRFRALGTISSDADWIELYLRSIIYNLKEVVSTDKTFNKVVENMEEQEVGTTESGIAPTESIGENVTTRSMFETEDGQEKG